MIKKVIDYVKSKKEKLKLGNIDVKRDWGWGPEFVEVCNKILKSKTIDDYIIASGKTIALRDIIKHIFLIKKLDYKKYVIIDKSKKENLT